MTHAHELHPWNYPVPVREGAFVPLEPRHAEFNVVTDLGRLGPFGARREPVPPDELLYADFQTVPDYVIPGRLGSGRAGHHRGKYLKGVGRTPLAANWNERVDQSHATGHLATTSAIRELFVSWVLEAKGLSHRINPCEGLLLAPLDPALRSHQEAALRDADEAEIGLGAIGALAFPCDRRIQGLTVKGSTFARYSNFVWLMNNMDLFMSRDGLVHFLFLFTQYLDPTRALRPGDISPTRIATELGAAIERTLATFRDFFRAGVYWGTPQNNVAMDGRFLDLDLPQFVGGPFIGLMGAGATVRVPETDPIRLFGLNVLGVLYQIRIFVKLLRARFALLPELDFDFSSGERDFVAQLPVALDEVITPDHPLRDGRAAARVLLGWYRELCDVSESAWPELERMTLTASTWRLERVLVEHVELTTRPFEIDPGRGGISGSLSFSAVLGSTPRREWVDESLFLHGLLAELESIEDLDTLLASLVEARAKVAAYVRRTPP